jgi:pyoverdine/dityrosine biosynthesis protein Dit1
MIPNQIPSILTQQIVSIFEQHRMPPTPIDEFDRVGRPILVSRIDDFVNNNKTIEFVMLGYPMKSINTRDKVIGVLPDMAEEVSLMNFASFNEAVMQVYPKGIKITIVNDGLVFNDLLGTNDSIVYGYAEGVNDMSMQVKAPMQFLSLDDFYKDPTVAGSRNHLMENFGISSAELEKRILLDPDVNYLYRGMINFMEEELAMNTYPSNNQLHKAAKSLAKNMMLRNEAYSNLVKDEFSNMIRLSMHPSVNNGNKYSFQMIPSARAWTSPWHCALAIASDGVLETVHRKDAEAAGYHLMTKYNRPYYYQA